MHAVLQEHEMPLPKTWFASDAAVFRSLPLDCFPLVIKPYDGDGSAGLALLRHPEDVELLPDLRGIKSLYLAQEYLETEGWDLKLYGIGSQVWAVRKAFAGPLPGAGASGSHIVRRRRDGRSRRRASRHRADLRAGVRA